MKQPQKSARIVKPQTAKQRAATRRYSAFAIVIPPPACAPSTSWWCGASREEFTDRATQERERMKASKFGRVFDPTL